MRLTTRRVFGKFWSCCLERAVSWVSPPLVLNHVRLRLGFQTNKEVAKRNVFLELVCSCVNPALLLEVL